MPVALDSGDRGHWTARFCPNGAATAKANVVEEEQSSTAHYYQVQYYTCT